MSGKSWSQPRLFGVMRLTLCLAGAVPLLNSCQAHGLPTYAPKDPAVCSRYAEIVRKPSALPLDEYEAALDQFFGNWCHRDVDSGWVNDKSVRDTGPYTAAMVQGKDGAFQWDGSYHGTHAPVLIWYSPEMVEWLVANRPAEGARPTDPPPVPDGAIMVKEMYSAPASASAGVPLEELFPGSGAAIMVREQGASYDGWFWGWYGWKGSGWAPDWPASGTNGPPNMGFGQYCMNCHASARDMTFSDAKNLAGQPGEPLVFLSQDWFRDQYLGVPPVTGEDRTVSAGSVDIHAERAAAADDSARLRLPRDSANPQVKNLARLPGPVVAGTPGKAIDLPSQTYDVVWMPAGHPTVASEYLTSDQCVGCHDAGSTGLQFDMTIPEGSQAGLSLNLSPYATWRTSPMGLAGRDPIFYAQLASETQTFHPDESDLVQTTCLGCHGINGQRQYQIDSHARDGNCGVFDTTLVHAVPYPPNKPGAGHASYGALARDGISCMACHRMVLGKEATARHESDPQNACVLERQALLNAKESGFAKTFTGSFLVGPPDELYGPFPAPKQRPMQHTFGITPMESQVLKQSEMCGTCHTVHLPVFHDGKVISHVYEQTTYPEWAFSAYRTGQTIDGPLPEGPGEKPQSCQGCHMASSGPDGPFVSKIASIQEYTNFPEAENTLAPRDIDLDRRSGFAKHTLVGLNLFVIEMFKQFPDVLGIPTQDPMMVSRGLEPLLLTEREMVDQASNGTARIEIAGAPRISGGTLSATVAITSLTGHKFPSGVGFRRAFVNFEVLDARDEVLWASGRRNGAGVIVDEQGTPIAGELWWDTNCKARIDPLARRHQPHYQTVTAQDQAQIYQELVSTPPPAGTPVCGHDAEPEGQLTTSFLSICAEVKDNRLPPPGYLRLPARERIARALGADVDLAQDSGFTAVGNDPDYAGPTATGGDRVTYAVPLADVDGTPAAVRATLYYQATPPFFLQDRFCTAEGDDTDRLAYLATHLELDGTRAEDWAFEIVGTGKVPVKH